MPIIVGAAKACQQWQIVQTFWDVQNAHGCDDILGVKLKLMAFVEVFEKGSPLR